MKGALSPFGKRGPRAVRLPVAWALETMTGDPETNRQNANALVGLAKDYYYLEWGTEEEKQAVQERYNEIGQAIVDNIEKKITDDWDEAVKDGKEAEMITEWTTQGILEVASLFIGVGEIKAVATADKVAEYSANPAKVVEA